MRFSPRVQRIAGDGAAAWRVHVEAMAARARGEDVVVMSVGDPDFATPEPIREAAIAALRAGDTHYTGVSGREDLRARIAERHRERTGNPTTAENVVVLAGAQCGLFSTAQCLCAQGDEAVVLDPCYVTYDAAIRASGAAVVRAAPRDDGSFRPSIERIAAAVGPRTRAIFFASPNNPTGVALGAEEIEGIAAIAREHDLWVVADEVYADLIFDHEHHSIAALPGMAERTATVSSLSKSHAMTGWRSGWVVAPPALAGHLGNLALCMLYGLPGFVQRAALEALTHGAPAVTEMRARYRARRDRVVSNLRARLGDLCRPPEAGMFALLDVRPSGLDSGEFCAALFREERVSLLDAGAFGPSAAGYVRVSFTLDEAMLDEGCARICRFFERQAAARGQPPPAPAGRA